MTSPATTVAPWQPAATAASLMAEWRLKRLPVVHHGKLVGIVTRADLVRAFARSDEEVARDIREQVLQRMYWLSPEDITVMVKNGDVRLLGAIDSEAALQGLPSAIRKVPGVVSVDSRLVLVR